jgi:hypothetical protein
MRYVELRDSDARSRLVMQRTQTVVSDETLRPSMDAPNPEVGTQLSFYPQLVTLVDSTDPATVHLTELWEERPNILPVDLIGMYFTG